VIPPRPPRRLTHLVRYWLAPDVARYRDVDHYFPDCSINYHPDGSAIISARVSDLDHALRMLIHYGASCVILEPEELVELFRKTASDLLAVYQPEPPAD
jgi:predicted DNA-binding transcriptional regulator YafY